MEFKEHHLSEVQNMASEEKSLWPVTVEALARMHYDKRLELYRFE